MIRKFLPFVAGLLIFASSCTNSTKETENKEAGEKDTLSAEVNSVELKKLNEMLKADPNNPHLYYKRGQVYLGFKDFEAAIEDANRAIKIDSLNTDSFYILLTDASFTSGQTRMAKTALERCIKNIPTSTKAYLKLAEMYFFVKKYQESITNINSALKIDPTNALGYFLKGMCYKESGDTALAISSMQTACEQDDKYYDAYMELGSILAAKKSMLCIEYFNNALRVKPQSTEAIYFVGKFYQDTKRIPQAVDAYNKLLSVDKKNKHALYNLGAINYTYLKDVEKAKGYFTKAIDSDAEYAEAYLARGICFEDSKNLADAEADYKMAVQIKPNYDPAIEKLNSLLDKKKGK
ncbi:MAG TPA: tetratricopeptide repeat protein [Bacteroidia bacterium]|nr:tetratricopeptide repeat protein [Bacteroidia bacterium]